MASYQNDEEQSLILNVEEQSYNVKKAKSKMALYAGMISVSALALGAIYTYRNSNEISNTNLAYDMKFGNAALGVLCPDLDFTMENGKDLFSENGKFRLSFQSDGNLILYKGEDVLWNTETTGNDGASFKFQSDGDAIIYKDDRLIWSNNQGSNPNSFLLVQNDGNFIQYDRKSLKKLWESGSSVDELDSDFDVSKYSNQCFTESPTLAPVTSPTEAPVDNPTSEPVAVPTLKPTGNVAAFSGVGSNKKSSSIKEYANDIIALSKIDGPSCSDEKSALTGLAIQGAEDSALYWDYNCADTSSNKFMFDSETESETSSFETGPINNFDHYVLKCPEGEYLSGFQPKKEDEKMKMTYKCVKFAATYSELDCKYMQSKFNEVGDSLNYLGNHKLQCDEGEAITKIKGVTQMPSGRFEFKYTCCPGQVLFPSAIPSEAPISEPTQNPTTVSPTEQPVSSPTENPVAIPTLHPTEQPVETPTEHPSQSPVTDPTLAPVAFPTSEPVPWPTMAPVQNQEFLLEDKVLVQAQKDLDAAKTDLAMHLEEKRQYEKEYDDAKKHLEEEKDPLEIEKYKLIAEQAYIGLYDTKKKIFHDEEVIREKEEIIDQIKYMKSKIGDQLVCPFDFESGATKVVIPSGCVFFGINDINHNVQLRMKTAALYVCTNSIKPYQLNAKDFEKYGLIENGVSSISMIEPGNLASVDFYSEDELAGSTGKFTSEYFKPLFQFRYPHSKDNANDKVLSALVTSSTNTIPAKCSDLITSDKMKLSKIKEEKNNKKSKK